MKRRAFLATALAASASPRMSAAQAPGTLARVGWVTAQTPASLAPYVTAFRAALAERGYVEGRNLMLEMRYGDDTPGRVPALARELARRPVDVIVTQGAATFEVRNLALPVPIVFTMSADPVAAGFVDDLAHPRGNMTGVTLMAVELNGKRLELLRELVPRLRRVAVIGNPEHPGAQLERAFSEEAGRGLGIAIDYVPTPTAHALARALQGIALSAPQAISLLSDGFAVQHRQRVIDFATDLRVPVISGWPVFAQSGALCTYGPRLAESYRRLAYFVDRILKGARPADLPIERPTTFELVINVKAAKALGVAVAPSLLVRADDVIA
ncbi:MAG: ABC transporter substrate-binding protein [Betaproteobacteria bacterium]